MTASAKSFRQTFKIAKENLNWYPGHMKHSFTHMQAKMRIIDCVVEVHDSRIPLSGRNPIFLRSLVGTKPHILVLNKKDLIDDTYRRLIERKFSDDCYDNVVFTNCLDQKCEGLKSIIPLATNLIQKSVTVPLDKVGHKMMIVGVPNVGKSSLINAIRNITISKGKATAVGAEAGVTRSVQNEVKVSIEPPIFLIDTPGIILPNVSDTECGMKLALCSCFRDETVGVIPMADFLLYWMNKTSNFTYVDYFGLKGPTDDILPLLIKFALDLNKKKKVRNIVKNTFEIIPDVHFAALTMVNLYRKKAFGDLNFDYNELCT